MPKDSANTFAHLENRRSTRYKADDSIVIESHNHRVMGVCIDYNEGGFGAIMEGDLPVGQIVFVEFPVSDRKPTRLQVRTIYRRDSRYGFEFIAPAGSQRQTFVDFFRERLQGDF